MVAVNHEAPSAAVSRSVALNHPTRRTAKKNTVQILSQNARGLKSVDRIEELTTSMNERGVFATCIQETWRTGSEVLDINSCKLILNGLSKKQQTCRRGSQGVGIVLSSKAVEAWKAAGCEMHELAHASLCGML